MSYNAGLNDNPNLQQNAPPHGPGAIGGGHDGKTVRLLNSLLRGEIAAAETYRQAIDRVGAGPHADDVAALRQIQESHGRTAQALRDRILHLGGEPVDTSGAWGAWARTVQATMNLFGDASALKALKEGEEHGLKDYRDALHDVDADNAQWIANHQVPQQQNHIVTLDRMIARL